MPSGHALEKGRTERTAIKVSGLALLSLTFQTLGIIYSDIGTSPLYTLNGIWPASGPVPPKEDVIGGISAVIWALTLLPLLKYVGICLNFGTKEGEGGTFALYQGLFPQKAYDITAKRTLTEESVEEKSSSRSLDKIPDSFRWPVLAWALLGTSLTLADGVFTPAVSVTSAVSGIAVAEPSVSKHITPISIALLLVLFLAQPFGTSKLAFTFAPIICAWILLLAGEGIANILVYPGILRAFDPSRAVMLFIRTRNYDLLSGVILALTGCEAIFANLGQFNILSIQLSFSTFLYPSLLLAYLGQGARLIKDGEAVIGNLFYETIPGSNRGALFWVTYVVSLLAAIIASQALITATFSLTQQLVNMKSLPPLSLKYTSDLIQGQVYLPGINWILMIATIAVVAAFKDLSAMTNAYGFAVATVMFVTTCLIALQICYVKGWPFFFGFWFFVIFGFLDGLFWGASLKKVPNGAWVPLMMGAIMLFLMLFWTWAKGLEDKFDGANRRNLRHFIIAKAVGDEDPVYRLPGANTSDIAILEGSAPTVHYVDEPQGYYYVAPAKSDQSITDEKPSIEDEDKRDLVRISSCAIFHKLSAGTGVPHSFVGFIQQWPALPRVVIFLAVHVLPVAHVALEDRYVANKVNAVQGFYTVAYYLGFRDDFDVEVPQVIERICALESRTNPVAAVNLNETIQRCAATYTHIVPHYYVSSHPVNAGRLSRLATWLRTALIQSVYRHLTAMFPDTKNWKGSADQIIRVGVNATI